MLCWCTQQEVHQHKFQELPQAEIGTAEADAQDTPVTIVPDQSVIIADHANVLSLVTAADTVLSIKLKILKWAVQTAVMHCLQVAPVLDHRATAVEAVPVISADICTAE